VADSAFEEMATAIIGVFNAEFSPEGWVMIPDNLHASLGRTRVDVGIAPVEDVPMSNNNVVQETWAEVKFYGLWKQEIKPDTMVNPFIVTAYAERFRTALRNATVHSPGTGQMWFFDVRGVKYPNDPTGNRSRFVMTIRAYGNNSALVETVA
jgi:hypothetical protein